MPARTGLRRIPITAPPPVAAGRLRPAPRAPRCSSRLQREGAACARMSCSQASPPSATKTTHRLTAQEPADDQRTDARLVEVRDVDDDHVGVELLHCPVERCTGKRHREHIEQTSRRAGSSAFSDSGGSPTRRTRRWLAPERFRRAGRNRMCRVCVGRCSGRYRTLDGFCGVKFSRTHPGFPRGRRLAAALAELPGEFNATLPRASATPQSTAEPHHRRQGRRRSRPRRRGAPSGGRAGTHRPPTPTISRANWSAERGGDEAPEEREDRDRAGPLRHQADKLEIHAATVRAESGRATRRVGETPRIQAAAPPGRGGPQRPTAVSWW